MTKAEKDEILKGLAEIRVALEGLRKGGQDNKEN